MKIFGKRAVDYVAFSRTLIGLVLIVGIVRLVLSLAGVPNTTGRWFSMTALMWIGVIYYAFRVHISGFGSYKQLLGVVAFPNFAAQAVAIVGIVIAIASGHANIFTAPEFAFGGDGRTWAHVAAHVFIGTTVGTLAYWLIGSVSLAIAKKLTTEGIHEDNRVSQL
jgi:hypothetical protein